MKCVFFLLDRLYDYKRCEFCVFLSSQGVDAGPEGLKLISEVIRGKLGITMTVLMGANIASEVAEEKFCETTIGIYSIQDTKNGTYQSGLTWISICKAQ